MKTQQITRKGSLCSRFIGSILFGVSLSFVAGAVSALDETPTPVPDSTPTAEAQPAQPDTNPTSGDILASDDFRDPGSGWANALVFDNYYVGYHEPDYYHVEVKVPEDKAVAALPGQTFDDATIETDVFRDAANTSSTGDFRYGLVARRAGSRFYAFAISPRTQRWYVLKSTPTSLDVLDQGTSPAIKEEGQTDRLRFDAQGTTLSFFINDELVSQVEDSDYSQGETGFYVETLDAPRAHIHFDDIQVSKPKGLGSVLASDDFRDPGSGWANALVFDNYYVGYHEPDYYHVEVKVPEDKAVAVLPGQTFDDATIETGVFRDAANTSSTGDFRYGLVARRAGSRFYAFAISPRTQRWYVLKSTPTSLDVLDQGTSPTIKEEGQTDRLRFDAQGTTLSFFINDELVSQVEDSDYSQGESGFYVETLDAPRAHIHFDDIQVSRPVQQPGQCQVIVPYLNVRAGPGTTYQPPVGLVQRGNRLIPSGRNTEGSWIYMQVVGGTLSGWVSASTTYIDCEQSPIRLPIRAAPPLD